MALKADLYLDRIDISKYLPEENCDKACGFSSCEEWLRKAREGKAKITDCPRLGPSAESISKYLPKEACDKACGFSSCEEWIGAIKEKRAHITQCSKLTPNFVYALEVVLSLDRILPEIEITQHPVQGILGLHEINGAGPESPVLVTGNALATQDVLMAILSTTTAPFYLLFIDCLGHTVDMAMIYRTFTPEKLLNAIEKTGLASLITHRELFLPGVTLPLKDEMEAKTDWNIHIGPYCAGELPLFMGEVWVRPPGK